MRLFFCCLAGSLLLFQCTTSHFRQPSAASVLDKSGYLYDPADRSCDGFPRLQVETMPGTCLGLVLPKNRAQGTGRPWLMPRTIVQISGRKEFLVVDMGGWAANKGAIYLLRPNSSGTYENVMVKSGLNMPHALRIGPNGYFYVGETTHISRFRFSDGKVRDWEVVVSNLPRYKGYMHPLVALAFDPRNNDLFINAGSPSDHCFVKNHGTYSDCPEDTEAGLGAIYRIPGSHLENIPAGGLKIYEVTARGLRNSMAMEVHPSGMLVQGENGRDFPQLEEPYEEINAIDLAENARGKHFGWPYCNDFHAVSPEWKFSQNTGDPMRQRFTAPVKCSALTAKTAGEYQPPHILMPPHSAPLHLGYYGEGMLAPQLKGKLLVTWHGFQPTGHRLVAYEVDTRGLPKTVPVTGKETFSFNVKGACPVRKPYKPEGGLDRFAPYVEVISRWDAQKGIRPKGAPVAFTAADDGSLWITEDKNHVIVRLARSDRTFPSNCNPTPGNVSDPRIELLAWRHFLETNPRAKAGYENVRGKILQKYCAGCHGGFVEKDIATDGYSQLDFLVKSGFFVGKDAMASKLYQSLARTGEVPPMPPSDIAFPEGQEADALVQSVKDWIELLPGNLDAAVKRTTMKEARKVRQNAGNDGKTCGQFGPGDVVYVDSRPEAVIKKDGWTWTKTYVLPGDTRIFKNTCPTPVDGVYYMAVRRLQ